MDEDTCLDLQNRFKDLLHELVHGDTTTRTTGKLEASGRRPQEFIEALTLIAERHGVLADLQCSDYWKRCAAGNWSTTSLSIRAIELGVTILEIEAVYRLTYGGKS